MGGILGLTTCLCALTLLSPSATTQVGEVAAMWSLSQDAARGIFQDEPGILVVEIGGFTGLLATLLGKNPPDNHVWIVVGDAPGFIKAEGPLYVGGQAWRIELEKPHLAAHGG